MNRTIGIFISKNFKLLFRLLAKRILLFVNIVNIATLLNNSTWENSEGYFNYRKIDEEKEKREPINEFAIIHYTK